MVWLPYNIKDENRKPNESTQLPIYCVAKSLLSLSLSHGFGNTDKNELDQ